jgi:hypothetical protein
VWNTASQPYWTFAINNELLNLTSTTLRSSLAGFFSKLYVSTHYVPYDVQMMS